MRPKRPTHVLLDQLRITREGGDAIIDHADENVCGARVVMGPRIASMSDADIVDMYTGSSRPSGRSCNSGTRRSLTSRWAGSRSADVLRCIFDDAGLMGKSPSTSTTKSCRSRSSAGCSAYMLDGE